MTKLPRRTPRLVFLLLLALVLVLLWGAKLLARRQGWDTGLTALGTLLFASALLSAAIAIQRRILRRRLRELPTETVRALAEESDDIKYAFPTPGSRPVWQVVSLGVAGVALPTLPILVGPLALLQALVNPQPPLPQFASLALGFGLAWAWWKLTARTWSRWAMRQGLSAGEVQYHGERASILQPKAAHPTQRPQHSRDDAA